MLGKRLDAAGWEHRVLPGGAPAEELVAMKLNALLLDHPARPEEGWEFLERVSGLLPGLGIIVCTSNSTVAQRVRGLRIGADDWIAKPSHPEEVMARVEAVVRRRRRARPESEQGPVVVGELEIRTDQFQAFVAGRSARPHPPRVRVAQHAGRGCRQGARARGDLPAGLGLRDGARRPLRRRLRAQAAFEDREALAGLVYIHTHFGIGYRFEALQEGIEPAAGAPAPQPAPEVVEADWTEAAAV